MEIVMGDDDAPPVTSTNVPAIAAPITQVPSADDPALRYLNKLKTMVDDKDNSTVFPPSVIEYYLRKAGCEVADPAVIKLVGLEVQALVLEALEDVKAAGALKQSAEKRRKKSKDKEEEQTSEKFILTSSALESALKLRNIDVSYAPFHPGIDS